MAIYQKRHLQHFKMLEALNDHLNYYYTVVDYMGRCHVLEDDDANQVVRLCTEHAL